MGRKTLAWASVVLIGMFLFAVQPAAAQLGGLKKKIKQKVEKKTDEKTDKAIDKTIDKATGDAPGGEKAPAEKEDGASDKSDKSGSSGATAAGGAPEWSLYKKYDFVPGDKVIFYDDLSREEVGEFPSRWGLDRGVFEVAEADGRKWIVCTDDGGIIPKTDGVIPDKYTVELDYWDPGEGNGHWLDIVWLDAEGQELGYFSERDHQNSVLNIHSRDLATKRLLTAPGRGVHTLRIMATKSTIKCFLDNERMANVPQVEGFHPARFKVRVDLWNEQAEKYPMMFGTFRYAEGGKTMREQLDETGRIVTHGILFTSGSAEIRAESYKTLADIGALLTSDAALRVSIEGHTDSDGQDAANQKLSEARAASVRDYLVKNFQVGADRLESKGLGETKPIDTNDTAEGKANNRRVELVKL